MLVGRMLRRYRIVEALVGI
nr:unnamed protein product [Callosobruchus analis]